MEIASTPIQELKLPIFKEKGVQLFIKREDLNHPEISGNKFRKLKYNLLEAQKQGHTKLLTFGGAYSNHIYATAAAGKEFGFKTIGIIRGEEHLPLNATLSFALSCEMELQYMDREAYRKKDTNPVKSSLQNEFGSFYLIPEGGTNWLAIQGCMEILTPEEIDQFDVFSLSVGTGGTVAGVIQVLKGKNQVLGFSSLKGGFLEAQVHNLFKQYNYPDFKNWSINSDYHFGGYAKKNEELLNFILNMEKEADLLLDPIYTGKALYGLLEMIEKDKFKKGSKILFIHTGGLQGRLGFGLTH